MAITAVQEGGTTTGGTSVTRAFASNVTSGNRIVIVGHRYTPSADAFVAGDCTKSAGTATIDTVTLDRTIANNFTGTEYVAVGIWSALVTGSGSLTMQVGGGVGGSAHNIACGEYTSGVGTISVDGAQQNSATGTGTAVDSGNVTTTRNGLIVGGQTNNSTDNPETMSADGAFTVIFEETNGSANLCSSAIRRIVTGSVTDSASWTNTHSASWAAAVAAYVEPSAVVVDVSWKQPTSQPSNHYRPEVVVV